MNKDYYEHGDLYWVNLRPFFDKYILIKIIDYAYFGPAGQNSKYVYVYDNFVDSVLDAIPTKNERVLYMDPFNFQEINIYEIDTLQYIKSEKVESNELRYSFGIDKGLGVDGNVWIVNTKNGWYSYEQQYPFDDLYMLDVDSLYADHHIHSRILHEVFKNESKVPVKIEVPIDSKSDMFSLKRSSSQLYSYFLENTNKKYLDRPSFKSLVKQDAVEFAPDWDKNYPNFDPETKNFTILSLSNSDYKHGFSCNLIQEYKFLKPYFEQVDVQVSGGSVVALIASIIFSENDYLNQIDYARFKVVQMNAVSFAMIFGSDGDSVLVKEFYLNEILDKDKIEHFMTYMDNSLLEMYYTASVPERFGELIRYNLDDNFYEVLDKFRLAKDEVDYFGATINIEELNEHLGLIIDPPTIAIIVTTALTKKFKLADCKLLESELHIDIYMQNKEIAGKLYRFLKRSFKHIEAYQKMRHSLKLD